MPRPRALESLDVFERLSLQQSATGVYLRRTNYLYRDKAHFPQGIQVGFLLTASLHC